MKVLVSDAACVAGGAERLCLNVLPGLAALGVEVVWAVPEHRIAALEAGLPAAHGVRFEPVEWPRAHWRRWLAAGARRVGGGADGIRVGQYLRRIASLEERLGVDHVLVPWLLDEPVPVSPRAPRTVLLLDRNWAHFPGNFRRTPEDLDRQADRWLEISRRGIAISQAVADDFARALPARAAKLRSVPLAATSSLTHERWLETQSPAHEYTFFYPATVAQHKGHSVLFAAAEELRSRGGKFTLALSGHGTDTLAIPPSLAPHVRGAGYANRRTVDELYLRADCVVLPSLFEGLGLPLAEAISWGTRVICTDLPSYREQIDRLGVHDAVEVVPAGDAPALAAALQRALDRPPTSWEARRQLAAHSAAWTWEHVSRAVLAELAP